MHFSKTYSQLLLSLPTDLRENSIQYRQVPSSFHFWSQVVDAELYQLKKLVNQVVNELSSIGLSPAVLQELLERSSSQIDLLEKGVVNESAILDDPKLDDGHSMFTPVRPHTQPKVVYEVNDLSGRIEPRLRLWVDPPVSSPNATGLDGGSEWDGAAMNGSGCRRQMSLLWALQKMPWADRADAAGMGELSDALIVESSDSDARNTEVSTFE